jgi:putative ABC transport system substrate-binding protein
MEETRRRLLGSMGLVLVAPRLAHAQRPAKPVRLGFLAGNLGTLRSPFYEPLFGGLARRGWREGAEYSLEARESRGDPQRALAMARELVGMRVDLLIAFSGGAALAAKNASGTIPIVSWVGYPVEAGLAASLAHPGGNVTGVANYAHAEVWGKFVELLREVRPGMRELGVLWDYAPPGFPDGHVPGPVIEKAARQMGIKSQTWMVRSLDDLGAALSAIERGRVDAVIVSAGGGIHTQRADRIAEVFVRRRLPAITDVASPALFEKANCLIAYSPNVPDVLTRIADLVDRILRGARPAELPFEQPSRFDLVMNGRSARAINVALPQKLLLRADRVIE